MGRVSGVDQLFVKRCKDSTIGLLVAKVSDDFIFAGLEYEIKTFLQYVKRACKLGDTNLSQELRFFGCSISFNTGVSATMSIAGY